MVLVSSGRFQLASITILRKLSCALMYGAGSVDQSSVDRKMAWTEIDGAVAQLGERLICTQEVIGSIPFSSTKTGRETGL